MGGVAMGRKRKIDVWLSVAGFMQLCVLGVSGSIYTAYSESGQFTITVIKLGLVDVALVAVLGMIWYNTYKKSKK